MNTNAGVDALRGVGATTTELTVTSANVPVPLLPGRAAASTIVLDQNFVIRDLNLQLNITHANDPDLEAYLIASDGTRIKLFAGVGNTGTRANFDNTIFDSGPNGPDGRPITSIVDGGPPFRGRFKPMESLDQLVDSSSVVGAGVYTLEIVNNSTTITGTLNSWSLTFRKA